MNVLGVDLTLGIHSLVPAVVHIVLLVVVRRDVVVHHAGHLGVDTSPLWIVGPIKVVRSLVVPVCVSLREKLRVALPCKARTSSRHVVPGEPSSAFPKATG